MTTSAWARFAAMAAWLGSWGCGGAGNPAAQSAHATSDRTEVRDRVGVPRTSITRGSRNAIAVAFLVRAPDTTNSDPWVVALAALLAYRLPHYVVTPSRGVVRVSAVEGTLADILAAAQTPPEPAEWAHVERTLAAFAPLALPDWVRICQGLLGPVRGARISAEGLAKVQQDTRAAASVGVALVGSDLYVRAQDPGGMRWDARPRDSMPSPFHAIDRRQVIAGDHGWVATVTTRAPQLSDLRERAVVLAAAAPGAEIVDIGVHELPEGGACSYIEVVQRAPGDAALQGLALAQVMLQRAGAGASGKAPSPEDVGDLDPRVRAELYAYRGLQVGASASAPFDLVAAPRPQREASDKDVDAKLLAFVADAAKPRIEPRVVLAPSNEDRWMVLGSPCGTRAESVRDAGAGAAYVSAVAARVGAVPILSPSFLGVGLRIAQTSSIADIARLAQRLAAAWVADVPSLSETAADPPTQGEVPPRAWLESLEHPSWYDSTAWLRAPRAAAPRVLRDGVLRLVVHARDEDEARTLTRWAPTALSLPRPIESCPQSTMTPPASVRAASWGRGRVAWRLTLRNEREVLLAARWRSAVKAAVHRAGWLGAEVTVAGGFAGGVLWITAPVSEVAQGSPAVVLGMLPQTLPAAGLAFQDALESLSYVALDRAPPSDAEARALRHELTSARWEGP